jgi:hypothetical protein
LRRIRGWRDLAGQRFGASVAPARLNAVASPIRLECPLANREPGYRHDLDSRDWIRRRADRAPAQAGR